MFYVSNNSYREFQADSIRCVEDISNPAVTLVIGKKRLRYNTNGNTISPGKQENEVLAVLFDRNIFNSESDAENWWLQNSTRVLMAKDTI